MTDSDKFRDAAWRTASSSTSNNQCVEVAPLRGGDVAVRDSKNRDGAVLVFDRTTWSAFTTAIRKGSF